MQAQHPGLSLTAMYNVLEKLRAAARRGRACSPSAPGEDAAAKGAPGESALPLTPKERAIHEAGLVSVLRQLHDDIDAATAAAYGWPANLSDAEILTRLVALNAAPAAEEAAGTIRWLRPSYQNPAGQTTQTGLNITTKDTKSTKARASKTKEAWPKPLAERVAAVERALAASASPVTPAQLAKRFHRAKPADLAEILETLATLGRAHRDGEKFSA